jgi:hypothetical protein
MNKAQNGRHGKGDLDWRKARDLADFVQNFPKQPKQIKNGGCAQCSNLRFK